MAINPTYTAVPNNIRRQAKMLYVWYPKNRTDLNTIHEENDIIGPEELARVKAQLKRGKHTCLIMSMEHPRAYMIVESHNRTVTRLLSRDYRTLVKKLQHSYQEITGLLSRDYRTSTKRS